MVKFIQLEELQKSYPLEKDPLGDGNVFTSGKEYVVKIYSSTTFEGEYGNGLVQLAVELNIYSANIHPCILAPVAWSVRDGIGYLVMLRGEDITTAYAEGKITLQQIILDSLSAIEFLNSRGIAHADIKPANMIYHNGRCKIIDMGLARTGELFQKTYYITGELYTPEFRDIEYSISQYNNINCELYALVTSYMFILENSEPEADSGELCYYKTDDVDLKWLVKIALLPLNKRPSITTVLKRAKKKYGILSSRKVIYKEPTKIDACSPRTQSISKWLIKNLAYELKASTLFSALHLLNRVYDDVIDKNSEKMLACIVVMLASYLNHEPVKISAYLTLLKVDEDNFNYIANNMIASILKSTEGVLLTKTYWDYARSKEDLYPLLQDLLSCSDEFKRTNSTSNKCVRVKDFITQDISTFKGKGKLVSSRVDSKEENTCILDIEANIDIIERYWQEEEEPDIYLDLPLLLHNKEALKDTKLSTARNILRFLLQNKDDPYVEYVLNSVSIFDWQNLGDEYLNNELFHPFE